MNTHNICFPEEIRRNIRSFQLKKIYIQERCSFRLNFFCVSAVMEDILFVRGLTLALLNPDMFCLYSVDPDQLHLHSLSLSV